MIFEMAFFEIILSVKRVLLNNNTALIQEKGFELF